MIYTEDLAQYLNRLPYPCTKQECIDQLLQLSASQEIIALFERLPDRSIRSVVEVWSTVGEAY